MKTHRVVKDIMHVGTVLGPSAEASDVELAKLLLLGQLDVMAEVTVVPLVVVGDNYNMSHKQVQAYLPSSHSAADIQINLTGSCHGTRCGCD